MKNKKTFKITLNAIISAIMIIMAFTPLGYLKAGVVQISFMTIPVVIGAIILGPVSGGILGGVFGITSFIQCFGLDAFGTTLFGINPIFTFIMCMAPRILMGILAGLIFKGLAKIDKTNVVSYVVTCLSGAVMNTIFFMGSLILLFGNTSFIKEMQGGNNVLVFVAILVGVNGLIEAGVCAVVGAAISKVLNVMFNKRNEKKLT